MLLIFGFLLPYVDQINIACAKVEQEQLETFLAVAEDLAVKGLAEQNLDANAEQNLDAANAKTREKKGKMPLY